MGKYQRPRQARWDARHLRTVSTHVPPEEAAQFRRACSAKGVTAYAVLRAFVQAYVATDAAATPKEGDKVHNL